MKYASIVEWLMERCGSSIRTTLTLSRDDRYLFWQADETQYDRKTGERQDPKTVFAVFDVSDLIK